jgi:hypothetical protein
VLAWALIVQAIVGILLVIARMSWHHVGVARGLHRWEDPVLSQWLEANHEEDSGKNGGISV